MGMFDHLVTQERKTEPQGMFDHLVGAGTGREQQGMFDHLVGETTGYPQRAVTDEPVRDYEGLADETSEYWRQLGSYQSDDDAWRVMMARRRYRQQQAEAPYAKIPKESTAQAVLQGLGHGGLTTVRDWAAGTAQQMPLTGFRNLPQAWRANERVKTPNVPRAPGMREFEIRRLSGLGALPGETALRMIAEPGAAAETVVKGAVLRPTEEWAQKVLEEHPDWSPYEVEHLYQLFNDPKALAGTMAEMAPFSAGAVGSALLGTAATGTPAGGMAATLQFSAAVEGQMAFDETLQYFMDENGPDKPITKEQLEMADKVRRAYGPIAAGIELAQVHHILGLARGGRRAVLRLGLRKFLGQSKRFSIDAFKVAMAEGTEEVLQSIAKEQIQKLEADMPTLKAGQDVFGYLEDLGREFVPAALNAVILGTPGRVTSTRRAMREENIEAAGELIGEKEAEEGEGPKSTLDLIIGQAEDKELERLTEEFAGQPEMLTKIRAEQEKRSLDIGEKIKGLSTEMLQEWNRAEPGRIEVTTELERRRKEVEAVEVTAKAPEGAPEAAGEEIEGQRPITGDYLQKAELVNLIDLGHSDEQIKAMTPEEGRQRIREGRGPKKAVEVITEAEEEGKIEPGMARLMRYFVNDIDPVFDKNTILEITDINIETTDELLKDAGYPTHDEKGKRIDYEAPSGRYYHSYNEEGRSLLQLLGGADTDTWVHEWLHRFSAGMSKSDRLLFQNYHTESGNTQEVDEHFADEARDWFFEKKLHKYVGPIQELFERARTILKKLIGRIVEARKRGIFKNMPLEIEDLYARAFGAVEQIPRLKKQRAEQAATEKIIKQLIAGGVKARDAPGLARQMVKYPQRQTVRKALEKYQTAQKKKRIGRPRREVMVRGLIMPAEPLSESQRRAEVQKVRKEIIEDPLYEEMRAGTEAATVDIPGKILVSEKELAGEVKDFLEVDKVKKGRLGGIFTTADRWHRKNFGKAPRGWDAYLSEWASGDPRLDETGDINYFLNLIDQADEARQKDRPGKYGLNRDVLEELRNEPGMDLLITKLEALEEGLTPGEINQKLADSLADYGAEPEIIKEMEVVKTTKGAVMVGTREEAELAKKYEKQMAELREKSQTAIETAQEKATARRETEEQIGKTLEEKGLTDRYQARKKLKVKSEKLKVEEGVEQYVAEKLGMKLAIEPRDPMNVYLAKIGRRNALIGKSNKLGFGIKETDEAVILDMIKVEKERTGLATKFTKQLKEYSDKTGKKLIIVEPTPLAKRFLSRFEWLKEGYYEKGFSLEYISKKPKPEIEPGIQGALLGREFEKKPGAGVQKKLQFEEPSKIEKEIEKKPKVEEVKGQQGFLFQIRRKEKIELKNIITELEKVKEAEKKLELRYRELVVGGKERGEKWTRERAEKAGRVDKQRKEKSKTAAELLVRIHALQYKKKTGKEWVDETNYRIFSSEKLPKGYLIEAQDFEGKTYYVVWDEKGIVAEAGYDLDEIAKNARFRDTEKQIIRSQIERKKGEGRQRFQIREGGERGGWGEGRMPRGLTPAQEDDWIRAAKRKANELEAQASRARAEKLRRKGKLLTEADVEKTERDYEEWAEEKFGKRLPQQPERRIGRIARSIGKLQRGFYRAVEPSKLTEKVSREAYVAGVELSGIPEAGRTEWNFHKLATMADMTFGEFRELVEKLSVREKADIYLTIGKPVTVAGRLLQREANSRMTPRLRQYQKALREIFNENFKYLAALDADVMYFKDYFYGAYVHNAKADEFWRQYSEGAGIYRTTTRFTKKKIIPTVADALAFGLKLKDPNPVDNAKREIWGIHRLAAIRYLKKELIAKSYGSAVAWSADVRAQEEKQGMLFKDIYLKELPFASAEQEINWVTIDDPQLKGLKFNPDVARFINNMIAVNKTGKGGWRTFRNISRTFTAMKFLVPFFHVRTIIAQAIVDTGIGGFMMPWRWKMTTYFKRGDPIFQTPEYLEYVRLGGGQRAIFESESRHLLQRWLQKAGFNRPMRALVAPIKVVPKINNFVFERFIPAVKYAKYQQQMELHRQKTGRDPGKGEKIKIIKEGQNFYGEMNERLFGRSATVTSALRFVFMAPGFREGNYRTMYKAFSVAWDKQGGPRGRAWRSALNIPQYLFFTWLISQIGTLIMTGKLPEWPEDEDELRDQFKIATNTLDYKGQPVFNDLMTTDRDYYEQLLKPAIQYMRGMPLEATGGAGKTFVKTLGGMKSPVLAIGWDIGKMAMGEVLTDWKGDHVYYTIDPAIIKLNNIIINEIERAQPIPVSVYRQGRRKKVAAMTALAIAVMGVRTSISEKDKKRNELWRKFYDYSAKRKEMMTIVRAERITQKDIDKFNEAIDQTISHPLVDKNLREALEGKKLKSLLSYKVDKLGWENEETIEKAIELVNAKQVPKARAIIKKFNDEHPGASLNFKVITDRMRGRAKRERLTEAEKEMRSVPRYLKRAAQKIRSKK